MPKKMNNYQYESTHHPTLWSFKNYLLCCSNARRLSKSSLIRSILLCCFTRIFYVTVPTGRYLWATFHFFIVVEREISRSPVQIFQVFQPRRIELLPAITQQPILSLATTASIATLDNVQISRLNDWSVHASANAAKCTLQYTSHDSIKNVIA